MVIYDAECGFCRTFAEFLRRRPAAGRLRLEARLSAAAQDLLRERGLLDGPDSLVLIEDGQAYVRSDAVLHIAEHLPLPWRLAAFLLIAPKRVRDGIYDWVAARRCGFPCAARGNPMSSPGAPGQLRWAKCAAPLEKRPVAQAVSHQVQHEIREPVQEHQTGETAGPVEHTVEQHPAQDAHAPVARVLQR